MMLTISKATMALLVMTSALAFAASEDVDQIVSGATVPDLLGEAPAPGEESASASSPYIINGDDPYAVEKSTPKGVDHIFTPPQELDLKRDPRTEYSETGFTLPGTFEGQKNYIDLDKTKMAKNFRKYSNGSLNIAVIKNDYIYDSTADVINRTTTTGYHSGKGGTLLIRHDDYVAKSDWANLYWSAGGGVGFGTGKGFFADGTRSDTTFNLWELPLEAGIGLEVPFTPWFKISGTGGPSLIGLVQDRSDFERGDKGKRKFQYSFGYFAQAQFKVNLSLTEQTAYELFTESQLTNLYMNLEVRHVNYEDFQDPVKISGTSFGIGFTFEYL